MGEDKYENEKLIEYGFPEDVWFHVDELSSAHVYVRLPNREDGIPGGAIDIAEIPNDVLEKAAQLTKANSISGCKKESVDIIYTRWDNLLKTQDMNAGTVNVKRRKDVFRIKSVKNDKQLVKQLNKTKVETNYLDFKQLRETRDEMMAGRRKLHQAEQRRLEAEEQTKAEEERQLRSYSSLEQFVKNTETNVGRGDNTLEFCRKAEEDFM